jgi:hypothetical protein
MPSWSDIREFFDREWNVIKGAPGSFSIVVILLAIIIWAALSWRYSGQLDNKDSIIAARDAMIKYQDAQLHDYRDELGVSSPNEAKTKLDLLHAELEKAKISLAELNAKSALPSPKENKYVCVVPLDSEGHHGHLIEFGVRQAPTEGLMASIVLSQPITSARHWGNSPLRTDIQETEGQYTNQKKSVDVIFYKFAFSSPSITQERSEYAYVETQKPSDVMQVLYLENFWQGSDAIQASAMANEYGKCPRR